MAQTPKPPSPNKTFLGSSIDMKAASIFSLISLEESR